MLLRKGNIYRNVSDREAALLLSQGYEEVKESKPEEIKKKTVKK